ncbi:hypothetical protein IHQ71_26655 [Rhizobium sp. TH2]|uniref:phage NrS-1 polymerase family protein n=1 Tax=Rhizobium sp. TH2 TaxID=2775403 RepID=UPI002157F4F7|nr:DUF5906 domain-containing protein [Rhizobium sp. TH2]UVC08667.1 hypothetical protein IHQ71_26655 [Rhizobium sp. TH2]
MNVPQLSPRNNVPEALRAYPQFIVWKLVQKAGYPKPRKLPFNPMTGNTASATDPTTWADYATACAALAHGNFNGIGFVFTPHDPFVFIDLDDCRDHATGDWLQYARVIKDLWFRTAAWETSQSGNGLHGIVRVADKTAFSGKARKWSDTEGHSFECYISGRFVAFGHCDWVPPEVGPDCDVMLTTWIDSFPPRSGNAKQITLGREHWQDAARPGYNGPSDDDELIRRACASAGGPRVMFGGKASFRDLWEGNAVKLARCYPPGGDHRAFDSSQAELALAGALAWWTGCNPFRIERLMNRAPICQRKKWSMHADYRARTINEVCGQDRQFMTTRTQKGDIDIGDGLEFPPLPDILTLDEALADLVLVGGSYIASRRSKRVLKYENAMRDYAASIVLIDSGDTDREGKPVSKRVPVLKLWMNHPGRITVDGLTWQPGEPEICSALDRSQGGSRAYNMWSGLRISEPPADWEERVRPFLDHVAYLLPNAEECARFLQWLAHIFQKPNELPHTHYLMIARQTGIGRGTFASILTRALPGYVATNVDVSAVIGGGFNERISQKLLATFDEIREGNSSDRYSKSEALKSALTTETRNINVKYGAQYIEKNCCRFLMFSNHLDALPFDNNDRRVIVIANPDERKPIEWFERLHSLANDPKFIASVQRYLATLDIGSFKAGECAPMNAIKAQALSSMESDADKAARQFREEWQGDLATVRDLREFIGIEDAPKGRAMNHVYERAGMQSSGHKIKMSNHLETVLIVKGAHTVDDVKRMDNQMLTKLIADARRRWAIAQGGAPPSVQPGQIIPFTLGIPSIQSISS